MYLELKYFLAKSETNKLASFLQNSKEYDWAKGLSKEPRVVARKKLIGHDHENKVPCENLKS